MISLRSLMR